MTGGGVGVSRFDQMFLSGRALGGRTPEDWARHAWSVLSLQDQSLIKDGVVLDGVDANLAELRAHAETFADQRLPLLRRFRIAD